MPDEVAAISAEVHAASESFDIVMTTGKFTLCHHVSLCCRLQVSSSPQATPHSLCCAALHSPAVGSSAYREILLAATCRRHKLTDGSGRCTGTKSSSVFAGGVGPTLDDVTMAGVADALGCPLIRWACAVHSAMQRAGRLGVAYHQPCHFAGQQVARDALPAGILRSRPA